MRRKSLGQSPFKQKFGDSPGFAYRSAFHKDVLNSYHIFFSDENFSLRNSADSAKDEHIKLF